MAPKTPSSRHWTSLQVVLTLLSGAVCVLARRFRRKQQVQQHAKGQRFGSFTQPHLALETWPPGDLGDMAAGVLLPEVWRPQRHVRGQAEVGKLAKHLRGAQQFCWATLALKQEAGGTLSNPKRGNPLASTAVLYRCMPMTRASSA